MKKISLVDKYYIDQSMSLLVSLRFGEPAGFVPYMFVSHADDLLQPWGKSKRKYIKQAVLFPLHLSARKMAQLCTSPYQIIGIVA